MWPVNWKSQYTIIQLGYLPKLETSGTCQVLCSNMLLTQRCVVMCQCSPRVVVTLELWCINHRLWAICLTLLSCDSVFNFHSGSVLWCVHDWLTDTDCMIASDIVIVTQIHSSKWWTACTQIRGGHRVELNRVSEERSGWHAQKLVRQAGTTLSKKELLLQERI